MNIKKLLTSTLVASMLLTGCSSKAGKQVDGQYVLASSNGKNILADDFYDTNIGSSTSSSVVFNYILRQIINKECPVNDDMKAEVETLKKQFQSYIDAGQESYLKQQIQYYGFNSFEDYYQGYLEHLQTTDFFNKYIEEHFDEVFEDYYEVENPRKVYHILVKMTDVDNPTAEEKAKLDEVQNLLNLGKDFQETAKNYSDDGSASQGGYLGICGNSSNFVEEFLDMMNTLEPGKVSEAFKTKYGYHFMYIEDTTKEELKEELNKSDSVLRDYGQGNFYDPYLQYVIYDSYEVTYHDDNLKEAVEAYVDEALKQREESRK